MPFTKQAAFTKKFSDLPDVPSPDYTPTQIKEHIDNPPNELMTTVNKLIDNLTAETGAGDIGALDGTTPTTVQARLNKLETDKATNVRVANTETRITKNEQDITSLNSNKTNVTGDHKGTWQGFTPSQVDQTIRDQVNDNTAQLAENAQKIKDISINIKDYQAKGDGVTDDTIPIRDAIEACFNLGGGDVIIPISAQPFIFTSIAVKNNVRLRSTGGVLKLKDNTCIDNAKSYYLIHNNDGLGGSFPNVTLADLVIDGNMINNASFSVADSITVGGENCKVVNCKINNSPDSGIMFSKAKNSLCINNRIENGMDAGIYVNDGDGTEHYENIVSQNRITGFPNGGIVLKRITQRTIVSLNTIYDCGNGITLEHASTASDYSTNLEIINNRLRNIGQNYPNASRVGINIRRSKNVICSENRIENILGDGIKMEGSNFCTVNENKITLDPASASSDYGILATDRDGIGCDDNIISFNTVINPAGYGIRLTNLISGTPKNKRNIVKNNNLKSNIALRVDVQWEDNIISENILNGVTLDLWYSNPLNNQVVSNVYVNKLLSGAPSADNQSSLMSFFNTQSGVNNTNIISHGTTMPSGGSFTKNDLVLNNNRTEQGATGSKYVVFAWLRMTNGSTHTLNTDWQELRMLTGN